VVEREPAVLNRGSRLDLATTVGAVALTVPDLARSRAFYGEVLGMSELGGGAEGSLRLGGPDGVALLELTHDPAASPRDPRQTGLFHLAVLVPSRVDLARALLGVAARRWPLSGASDHLVSEALYLSDPDGNGIEVYRDRPRSEWPRARDGSLEMGTLALDLDDLIAELGPLGEGPPEPGGLAAGTRMGHVHLQVDAIADAEAFYVDVLGFDAMVRGYPGALFVAAGGYHHHIGLNTWNSRGGSVPGPGSAGLRWYQVRAGSDAGLAGVLERVAAAGLEVLDAPGGAFVRDPSGNRVLLTV
jgi:catechol 2,3-dioxygenase